MRARASIPIERYLDVAVIGSWNGNTAPLALEWTQQCMATR